MNEVIKRLNKYYDREIARSRFPLYRAIGNMFVAGIVSCLSVFYWVNYFREHVTFHLFMALFLMLASIACAYRGWQILRAIMRRMRVYGAA
jgi:hypothetical protein